MCPHEEEMISQKNMANIPGGPAGVKNDLLSDDPCHHVLLGWLVISIGIVGFLGWALFAPLDAGVPMEAKVAVSGNRKAVQPLVGGKVQRILVAEGEHVLAGQVLVLLDSTVAANQLDSLRFQYLSGLAVEGRLVAERDGLSEMRVDAKILLAMQEGIPQADEIVRVQQQLFGTRVRAQQAILQGLEAALLGAREQRSSVQRILRSRQQQRAAFERQLESQRSLAEEGLLARNRLLESERQYFQLLGSVADEQGRLGSLEASVQEYQSRLLAQREDYQKEVRAELSETRTRVSDLQSRLASAQYEAANMEIVAPTSGVVTALAVFTQGGVVRTGDRLMDIVPQDRPLTVEGRLPVQEIDKVHAGLPVDLEFMAFNRAATPKMSGTVTTVSADSVDDAQGRPYYRMEIAVNDLRERELAPGLILQPGMPVTAFIKTGERTLMSYLLKPLRDRSRLALIEK